MKKVWSGTANRGRRSSRDYNRKRYENPMFPRHQARGKQRPVPAWRKLPFGWILGAAVALGAFAYVVWSPAFAVTDVRIDGASPAVDKRLHEIVDARLGKRGLGIIPQSNIIFLSAGALTHEIGDGFAFNSLDIRKRLPHTVVITVSEKLARAALAEDGHFFAIDDNGMVIRELTGQELSGLHDLPDGVGSAQVQGLGAQAVEVVPTGKQAPQAALQRNKNDLPIIIRSDEGRSEAKTGENAVTGQAVALVLQAYSRLPDIAGAGIRWFTVPDKSETVDALVEGDWHILMASSLPFDVQGERLSLVLKDKVGDKRSQLDYVDLRYNERIFFKFKNAPAPKP
jgi:cell division septal protein FtsQ